ncbi:hypothetical protein GCM10027160_33060 [Streptomyces calidiresistens]|uniref:Uncharacterized protein n=1 Tax=Streptomyces calidiresistens TaxID=1485586 RepID=A0A7W3XXW2_9ACTN|nr:hypothetical protein [Streptomyces calidiresistens]MBB0231323.1 hypothetical protein [Streptomyces calidiresistens]
MRDHGGTAFVLPRGATGFFRPKDGPLPETDLRLFRTGLYDAARLAEGRVGEFEEQEYPRTFHTASILSRREESVVLCHVHHPWIVFVGERGPWHDTDFIEPPGWARAFSWAGFEVLDRQLLSTPLEEMDTSGLSPVERRACRFPGTTTLGGLLFNAWD